MTLKDELTRSVGAQYATGEEWIKMPERDRAKPESLKTNQTVHMHHSLV